MREWRGIASYDNAGDYPPSFHLCEAGIRMRESSYARMIMPYATDNGVYGYAVMRVFGHAAMRSCGYAYVILAGMRECEYARRMRVIISSYHCNILPEGRTHCT